MSSKVKAGTAASTTVGIPLATIIVWMWNSSNPDNQMPAEVGAALGAVIAAALSLVAGWMKTETAV